ncbi:hypothetical protein BST11_06360 [Mycobacterium alsense]|uniref:Uncharacterized protein n=1 Tax=Mycobacterium alsense TaxID=324058 RepID=A0AA41XQP9_9MYCO|nr:hypothetical protein [Mycobacterium alsense]MCV7380496.1 hypothetical protein [Mycobacterium alsense]OQZ92117.1 hypothetical protein BST11_06360 [Mycobacterium alsense]
MSHSTTAPTRIDAIAWAAKTLLAAIKPRWRPAEEDVVLVAITVILVALGSMILLGAGAILTMG